jgi:hypothetical protein
MGGRKPPYPLSCALTDNLLLYPRYSSIRAPPQGTHRRLEQQVMCAVSRKGSFSDGPTGKIRNSWQSAGCRRAGFRSQFARSLRGRYPHVAFVAANHIYCCCLSGTDERNREDADSLATETVGRMIPRHPIPGQLDHPLFPPVPRIRDLSPVSPISDRDDCAFLSAYFRQMSSGPRQGRRMGGLFVSKLFG